MQPQPSPRPRTAWINASRIAVNADETLLQAALRQGVDMPYSCRVGGCATCKCRLVEGRVRQLTQTRYLISDGEMDAGMILACQSVPLSDVRVLLDSPSQPPRRRVSGHVIAQARLTRDITRLRVQLDQPLSYQAGQHAQMALGSLPGLWRSYSFAAPCSTDAQVEFFVRKVPGGLLSSAINDQDLLGQSVQIDGPLGDFTLRPANGPLLLVAGGSGLAPVLAILKDALARGVTRPATLLFGARTADDLYALDEIQDLARRWPAAFTFVPVLSEAQGDAGWSGARGLVTEQLAQLLPQGAHVYLCGPPGMIDAAVAVLGQQGIPRERVHADRFTTRYESLAQPVRPAASAHAAPERVRMAALPLPTQAGVLDYLKYTLFHVVGLGTALALVAGGAWITACLVAILAFYVLGDAVCGDDAATPRYRHPRLLTWQLWLALPCLALIVFVSVWGACTGDPLGFGAWVSGWSGYDVLAAREATDLVHRVSAVLVTALMIGMVGTIPAHELTHRTWDRVSMAVGRWLLAFSFDTAFSIEHVYGHHRYVATLDDPATAPRGRNVYGHIVRSTLQGQLSAWKIETRSLRRLGLPVYGWHNAVIRGHLMSLGLLALAWLMGGAAAAGFFMLCALGGKALLEIVNYMEHYGLVRDPSAPVQPRHSWNTNRRISSWSLFNLTRHSHHHAQGEVPFHELQPYPEAPTMIGGYLTTILVALIPPLWHRRMAPKLRQWDRDFASDEERLLAQAARQRSGHALYA